MIRAVSAPESNSLRDKALHVIAAGKAAGPMANALAGARDLHIKTALAIGTHLSETPAPGVEWHESAHPTPDERSLAAATRALDVARGVARDECLVLLLSGGASSLMALPAEGITLSDKQEAARAMMLGGADIHALNTVRKHLSAIKGGQLAAACAGDTVTLAVSDVVGDDLSVIASGPGVPDATTWLDAQRAFERYGSACGSQRVRERLARGARGEIPETPKPGDPLLRRASARVIASARHAVDAARAVAEQLGYRVVVLDTAVGGEARLAAPSWFHTVRPQLDGPRPVCVLSSGETTVTVRGKGRGGRNQEFVLSLAAALAAEPRYIAAASVGTDGVDGPTDAAGAWVDTTSLTRGAAVGLDAASFLDDNNSYDYFAVLGDLIRIGRTDTNVGDVQVLLAATPEHLQ